MMHVAKKVILGYPDEKFTYLYATPQSYEREFLEYVVREVYKQLSLTDNVNYRPMRRQLSLTLGTIVAQNVSDNSSERR